MYNKGEPAILSCYGNRKMSFNYMQLFFLSKFCLGGGVAFDVISESYFLRKYFCLSLSDAPIEVWNVCWLSKFCAIRC